jgi:hypothetical protein
MHAKTVDRHKREKKPDVRCEPAGLHYAARRRSGCVAARRARAAARLLINSVCACAGGFFSGGTVVSCRQNKERPTDTIGRGQRARHPSYFLCGGRQRGPCLNVRGRERAIPKKLFGRRFRRWPSLRDRKGVAEQRKYHDQIDQIWIR